MFNSLKKQFLILILLPVVAAFGLLSLLSYRTARSVLINEMVATGHYSLEASAERVAAGLRSMDTALQISTTVMPFHGLDESTRHEVLKRIKAQIGPTASAVFVAYADGIFSWSDDRPLPGSYNPLEQPWYTEAKALPANETSGMTSVYWDRRTGGPTFTKYRVLSDDKGRFAGVMGIQIDIKTVQTLLSENDRVPAGGTFMIVDEQANILVSPAGALEGLPLDNDNEKLDMAIADAIRDPGVEELQKVGERRNGTWYMGFKRVPGSRVFVVLRVPARAMLTPLYRLTIEMTAVAVPLIGAALVLLLLMTRRISRPIVELKRSAQQITAEDNYQEALPVNSRDEIGQLTAAFNDMMVGLRQRDFIRETFGRYVTQEVAKTILDSPEGLSLVGENREVTVMFADLRGFTPLSESLAQEVVVGILNRYLGRMASIISSHKGTVNEFIGDGILALFGAPVADVDGPLNAVSCAVDMQLAVANINRDHLEKGLPEIHMGVGINTGVVIVGNIGSEKRAKYGVVGHEVNLAARVESAALGGQVLVTEATYQRARDAVAVRERRMMRFKGVDGALPIYDIRGMRHPAPRLLPADNFDGEAIAAPQVVRVRVMTGKQAEVAPCQGRLTHASTRWLEVVVQPPLAEDAAEIRLDLDETPGEATASIYARIVHRPRGDIAGSRRARISYMTPEARARLVLLTAQPGTHGDP